jgi:FtsP/CotA-like multicopper oxidase with cupredoxin domain
MAQGHGWFDKTKYLKQHKLNTANPLRRDTASVEGFGWMWIRFVTDNPGAWAFHCEANFSEGKSAHLLI